MKLSLRHASIMISTLVLMFCLPLFAHSEPCISDYMISQRQIPHHLTAEQLESLRAYAASGDEYSGWAALAAYGDHYAAAAEKMTNSGAPRNDTYQRLLATHWKVTNNRQIFEQYSARYAQQHFRQYVEILQTGYWPDSDQILNSYLAAARKLNLPADTALVAVWSATPFGHIFSWQGAIDLGRDRVVQKSRACVPINFFAATRIMYFDATLFFIRLVGGWVE